MKLKKQIPADQLIGLAPDLEGMVQSIRGQQTVGKEKKAEEVEVAKEEVAAPKKKVSAPAKEKVEKTQTTKKYEKSTKLENRQVDIEDDDSEMDIFNKYVDFYAGQPGRGRAVWLEDELVESFSKLKDYDSRYSIRTVVCAILRTFIEKNGKELGELKRPQKKGLF